MVVYILLCPGYGIIETFYFSFYPIPIKQSYQTLFEMAIKEAQNSPVSFGDLVTEIFETLMKLERDMFLRETGDAKNKGNGFYQRFIPYLPRQARYPRPPRPAGNVLPAAFRSRPPPVGEVRRARFGTL
jgi:hypothetical protein